MEIEEAINHFRLASRELFNHYFRIPNPYENNGWELEEAFEEIEELLFQKMVIDRCSLPFVAYGQIHPHINIQSCGQFAPWLLNRELNLFNGYWDHPLQEFTQEAVLEFVSFFDFDHLSYRDNRYVMVFVRSYASNPEAEGRYALVESQYVKYIKA